MASRPDLKVDDEVGFVRFFRNLEALDAKNEEGINAVPVRIFDRGDYFTVHGEDARLVARSMYKTTSVIRQLGKDLDSVTLTPAMFRNFIRELLFRLGRRLEIWESSGRSNWTISRRGSPGNLEQLENDIEGKLDSAPIIVAVKLAVKGDSRRVGVCFADPSVHELGVCEFVDSESYANFESLLIQLGVKECIFPPNRDGKDLELGKLRSVAESTGCAISSRPASEFSTQDIEQDLTRLLKDETTAWSSTRAQTSSAGVLPYLDLSLAMAAASALIKYIGILSDASNFGQYSLFQHDLAQYMRLDGPAVRAVNLMPGPRDGSGAKAASLYGLLNHCKTPIGGRLLAQWLHQPLMDLGAIEERQLLVEAFVSDTELRQSLQEEHLRSVPDLYRLSRKFLRKVANLEDVVRAYQLAIRMPALVEVLDGVMDERYGDALKQAYVLKLQEALNHLGRLQEMVETTVDLEALDRHEFIIKPDFDDRLRTLRRKINSLRAEMDREHSRVANDLDLDVDKKIFLENHKVHGWCFRVTRAESSTIRGKREYQECSTQKNGVYFTTSTQQSLRREVSELTDKYERMQSGLVNEVVSVASSYVPVLERLAGVLAHLDVIVSFAHVSVHAPIPYVRPTLKDTDSDADTVLTAARHPCLEAMDALAGNNTAFIPNDVRLCRADSQLTIITGPNMGGKSTYIRMVGVIAVMAQIGCFVPCESAELRIFDAILARVGAGDAQLRGISTFMAEMLDTASILSSATPRSLVLVDELGRGTSTYDGFGLAWAIAEHLVDHIRAFTLFATHFHEVTALADRHSNVRNLHVVAHINSQKSAEKNPNKNNSVTLLYKVAPGIADQSFGIQVAEMVHFPPKVVSMARRRADELEFLAHSGKSQSDAVSHGAGGILSDKSTEYQKQANRLSALLLPVVKQWKELIAKDPSLDRAQELKRLVSEQAGLTDAMKAWKSESLFGSAAAQAT